MTEPNTTLASTGAALVTLATLIAGPILGEYAIIIAMGLLGTLVALSEIPSESLWKSIVFTLRGVVFSFVFTGVLTLIIIKYFVPKDVGLSSYAVMGCVAFCIGWGSNKMSNIRDFITEKVLAKTFTNNEKK